MQEYYFGIQFCFLPLVYAFFSFLEQCCLFVCILQDLFRNEEVLLTLVRKFIDLVFRFYIMNTIKKLQRLFYFLIFYLSLINAYLTILFDLIQALFNMRHWLYTHVYLCIWDVGV